MRIAAFFALLALFVLGVTTTQIAQPVVAADPTTTPGEPSETCSTIFVGGKGVIDSCSKEHNSAARVYPRKPGVPANGCAETCPEAVAPSTPGPGDKATGTPTRPVSTPVPS